MDLNPTLRNLSEQYIRVIQEKILTEKPKRKGNSFNLLAMLNSNPAIMSGVILLPLKPLNHLSIIAIESIRIQLFLYSVW